ncbi:hypothetical protein TWF481_011492 [Arthrobotrys musiformis]|uniref:Uncharacterized protein n=1 Tax=Arthrobotrys musiformis TaxID=47236 RepID=A0AAV9VYP9_9PEZI
MLTATLLAAFAFVRAFARDPIPLNSNIAGSNNAPPPGFSETLSIYGPEPNVVPLKTQAAYFSMLLQLSSTNEWDAFNVFTTDYTTCHTLNPAIRAIKSRVRAALSSTGSRDAQPGIKNMGFRFPDNTVAPDISIKVFRTAPPVVKGGRVASGSTNPYGSCYEAAGSRDSRVVNIQEWIDMNEDDRLKWLKPRWWAPFYYRLRETDSFLVMPPPVKERASLGVQAGPQAGRTARLQAQKESDGSRRRDESYEALRELGIQI